MLKPVPDKAFEGVDAEPLPPGKGGSQLQAEPEGGDFYHPDEGDRAARAKRWIEQARGKGQEPKD